ncbi:NAD(P)H-dependent oxidoreductase [Thorsellia kenyensis]|uniref:FMN dependent NADH:quinone oxidoreductase n=1 Tax=Thorsellia kenyensis TaxID=1549888 RepID=A0ABV6C7A4_9GAMM
MRKVLFLKSSILGDYSQSNALVDFAIKNWEANHPNDKITLRDLNESKLPTLDSELVSILRPTDGIELSSRQKEALALSDSLIAELKAHDTLVIGTPLYNYNISSQLKNYFDLVCRAGETFKYTEKGPEGLLAINEALVLKATGGIYGENAVIDQFFNQILPFIGVKKVTIISAEGIAYGDEMMQSAIAGAKDKIEKYVG